MKLLRLCLLALLVGALVPSASFANEKKPHAEAKSAKPGEGKAKEAKGKDEKGKGESKDDYGLFSSQDNLVPLPTIIAPVLCNERLTSHLYIYIAAITADASTADEVKKRLPYVQDALVREVNNHVLTVADPNADPDTKSLIARFKSVINTAVGKPLVTEIQVGRIDTSPY